MNKCHTMTKNAFQDTVFTQVINLDRSEDRLIATTEILDQIDLTWTRLSAIGPTPEDAVANPLYNRTRANYMFGRDLLKGEIGCFLSHLSALEEFEKSGAPFGLIMEDDITLDAECLKIIHETLELLGRQDISWDCINLTKAQKLRRRSAGQVRGRTLYRAYHFPLLTSGLLWQRGSAKQFIE